MFELLREMHFDNGMPVLDINCSTHKYVLQYLFLPRIDESLSQWKETWNSHKLRLPHGQTYTDSITSSVQRSIVPKHVMETCSVNFAQYSELYKLEDEETFQYLFQENMDQFTMMVTMMILVKMVFNSQLLHLNWEKINL